MSENYRILTYSDFLASEYLVHLSDFNCSDDDLNDFFKSDAAWYHEQNLAATHVVCSENDIVAFFTLTADCLHKQRISPDDAVENFQHLKYPALKIARLAANLPYQKSGVGTWCMKKIFVVSSRLTKIAAFRFITVDAKLTNDVWRFYSRFGFRQVPTRQTEDTIPMYLDFFALYTDAVKNR